MLARGLITAVGGSDEQRKVDYANQNHNDLLRAKSVLLTQQRLEHEE